MVVVLQYFLLLEEASRRGIAADERRGREILHGDFLSVFPAPAYAADALPHQSATPAAPPPNPPTSNGAAAERKRFQPRPPGQSVFSRDIHRHRFPPTDSSYVQDPKIATAAMRLPTAYKHVCLITEAIAEGRYRPPEMRFASACPTTAEAVRPAPSHNGATEPIANSETQTIPLFLAERPLAPSDHMRSVCESLCEPSRISRAAGVAPLQQPRHNRARSRQNDGTQNPTTATTASANVKLPSLLWTKRLSFHKGPEPLEALLSKIDDEALFRKYLARLERKVKSLVGEADGSQHLAVPRTDLRVHVHPPSPQHSRGMSTPSPRNSQRKSSSYATR